MAVNQQKLKSLMRELKRHQKDLAKTRDKLVDLKATVEALEGDTETAMENVEAAIVALSALQ